MHSKAINEMRERDVRMWCMGKYLAKMSVINAARKKYYLSFSKGFMNTQNLPSIGHVKFTSF